MITETQQLVLSEAVPEDADFFLQLLNSPGWLRFIGDRHVKTTDDAAGYINRVLRKSYAENGFGFYKMTLKDGNIPIGICGFAKRDYLPHPDVGFAILPGYEGKGIMYEAATAVMEYGRLVLKLPVILATTLPDNKRSQQLLLKLGLREAGTVQPADNEPQLLLFSTE